jgi:hypothetical protein
MAKLKAPLFGFDARGSIAKLLTFRHHGHDTIVGIPTTHPDAKSPAQLGWRTMYEACSALWHTLSDVEKQAWESNARAKHMTGFALWQSQCLRPNPGIYLPLAGGTMSGDILMASHKVTGLPLPTLDPDAATKAYVDAAGGAKIKLLSISRDLSLADEDVSYSGVGFTPSILLIYARVAGYATSSWGFAKDNANQRCYFAGETTNKLWSYEDTIWAFNDANTDGQEGWLLTIDTDGFTIGWYKSGNPVPTCHAFIICLA